MALIQVAARAVAAPPSRRQQCSGTAAAAAPSRQPRPFRQRCPPQQLWGNRERTVCLSSGSESGTSTATAAAVPEEAAELSAEGQQQWAQCAALLADRCGLEGSAADTALLKAFGWKGQGFWRQERVKEVPCPQQVAASLDFLAGLGLAEPADACKLVATFPEVLGLRVEVMADNVQVLREKWSMKGNVLLNAVKRKPRVLGNCIDCEGTCAGLCTRCWAQF